MTRSVATAPFQLCLVCPQFLKKHVLTTMTSFLDKFNVLSDKQHAFVAKRGTRHLLETFSGELFMAFENNVVAYGHFLNVSKAFNTVNHHILLNKLYSMGFRGPFFKISENFFSIRRQLVSMSVAQ